MTFKEFYEVEKEKPTPAAAFISRIAKATCKEETTVRMWLMGRQVPDALTIKVIAEELGTTPETLFQN
ncbi:MAG: hypothetical protein MJZ81_06075 [Bacteroidales bacterium]|nr:hypothetical protein [Bacteroidales bacterium]